MSENISYYDWVLNQKNPPRTEEEDKDIEEE